MPLSPLHEAPLISGQWRSEWNRADLDGKHDLGITWLRRLLWGSGDNRAPVADKFVGPQVEANLEWVLTILPIVDPYGWLAEVSKNGEITLADRAVLNILLGFGSRRDNAPLHKLRTLFTTPPGKRYDVLDDLSDRANGEMVFTECNDFPQIRQMLNVLAWDVCAAARHDAKSQYEALRLCLTSGINHRYAEAPSPLLGALQQIHHRAEIQTSALPDDMLLQNPDLLASSIMVFAEDWILLAWDVPFCPMNYIGWCNAQSNNLKWDGSAVHPTRFSTLLREYARPNGTPAELIANLFSGGQIQVDLARIMGQSPQDVLRELSKAGVPAPTPSVELPQLIY